MYGNKKLNKKISKKQFKSISNDIVGVPKHLMEMNIYCKNCNNYFKPNWREKVGNIETAPMNNHIAENGEPYIVVPVSIGLKCTNRKESTFINIEHHLYDGQFLCFIDEAYRDIGNKYLVLYTQIWIDEKAKHKLKDLYNYTLNSINGYLPKDNKIQNIHMTELFEIARKKHLITMKDLNGFYEEFSKKRCELINEIQIACCFDIIKKCNSGWSEKLKESKKFAMTMLFTKTIDELTKKAKSPKFIIEQDGKSGWIDSLFNSLRVSQMFPMLSHAIPMEQPTMIDKGDTNNDYHHGIEICDIICFVIARSLYTKSKKNKCEFDISSLGKIFYLYNERLPKVCNGYNVEMVKSEYLTNIDNIKI